MQKILVLTGISLAACLVAAAVVLNTSQPDATPTFAAAERVGADAATTAERIRALEAAVNEERMARQLLEEQLLLLYEEIDALAVSRTARDENRPTRAEPVPQAESFSQPSRTERVAAGRRDAMLAAGFTPERVDWIMQREEEVRFEALQARFEARNSGEPTDPFSAGLNPAALLRAELGDADYEKYLAANDRPTAAAVGNVLASSPAASAGLQPGDRIVAYDGRRVFDGGDLVQQTMIGGSGNVVLDVVRDGVPLQLVVPRGPIGVEIGQFRRR